jgi:hypothetical protein
MNQMRTEDHPNPSIGRIQEILSLEKMIEVAGMAHREEIVHDETIAHGAKTLEETIADVGTMAQGDKKREEKMIQEEKTRQAAEMKTIVKRVLPKARLHTRTMIQFVMKKLVAFKPL